MTHPQPQEISALDRVPDELLNEIFMLIAMDIPWRDECGFPTENRPHPLLPAVQVNRRFNAVASPLLVRKWRPELYFQSGAGFVLHLLKQPHLRPEVKSLSLLVFELHVARLGVGAPEDRETRWPPSFASTAEIEQLLESAEKACTLLAGMRYNEEGVSWLGQIGRRSPGAISALVLAWATGLEELDLMLVPEDFEKPDPWLIQLVKLAAGVLSPRGGQGHDLPPPSMFTKLRCVTLWQYYGDPAIRGTNAAPFFRLPGLRVFKAYSMDAEGLTLDEADQSGTGTALQPPADQLFPNGTSNVEEIHLHGSAISENGLEVMARACKHLRVLVLQWGNDFAPVRDFKFFSDAVIEAIKLHFASLKEILMDITEDMSVESYGDVDAGVFGDWLLRCDKLERLTINLEYLYGDENYETNSSNHPLSAILPAGLTSLSLGLGAVSHGAEAQATKENVLGLLRQCGPKGRFSRLKKLQLTDYIMKADEKQDFMGPAEEAGVALTLGERVETDWRSTPAKMSFP